MSELVLDRNRVHHQPRRAAGDRTVLTTTGARMLAAEVARLRALKEREFRDRRRDALDVAQSDTDAHRAIGEDEIVIDARIASLETLLRQAEVVDHEPAGDDVVTIGSSVTLEDLSTGRTRTHEMVAWHDGTQPGVVSAASPVGQAILGRSAGEEVQIDLPGGRVRRLRIAAVENEDAAAALL